VKVVAIAVALAACGREPAPAQKQEAALSRPKQTLRVAVVGGMLETGFWSAIAERYERATGDKLELAASGPKPIVVAAFVKGGIDVITVHASDAMVNLVADGLARDPQPWVRNDMVIVGPSADPAGVRGEKDAVSALGKIIAAKAPLLVHASHGADGVLHDLVEAGKLQLDPTATIRFDGENQHQILAAAKDKGAYTMVGRIPVLLGKLRADGIEVMVRGDPRLRRPYLVEVARNAQSGADDLVAFLRSPATQEFIATFKKGQYDADPLFFPVVPEPPPRPSR
jgi:tungstate transport system substrate-binding protein